MNKSNKTKTTKEQVKRKLKVAGNEKDQNDSQSAPKKGKMDEKVQTRSSRSRKLLPQQNENLNSDGKTNLKSSKGKNLACEQSPQRETSTEHPELVVGTAKKPHKLN